MKAEPILPWKQTEEYKRNYEKLLQRRKALGLPGGPSDAEVSEASRKGKPTKQPKYLSPLNHLKIKLNNAIQQKEKFERMIAKIQAEILVLEAKAEDKPARLRNEHTSPTPT